VIFVPACMQLHGCIRRDDIPRGIASLRNDLVEMIDLSFRVNAAGVCMVWLSNRRAIPTGR
jgi:hypothetical protein